MARSLASLYHPIRARREGGPILGDMGAIAVGAAAALAYLLGFVGRAPSLPGSVVKTLSVAPLAVAALLAGLPWPLVLALALGSLGDLALSLRGERAFLIGLIAFALSHIAYVVLFMGWPTGQGGATGLALFVVVLGFAVFMARRLWPATGALRWPVMGYVAVICAMAWAGLTFGGVLVWLGALLFVASDCLLAIGLFLSPAPDRRRDWAVWITYWLAQLAFLLAYHPGL